jgi:hypothetical protein
MLHESLRGVGETRVGRVDRSRLGVRREGPEDQPDARLVQGGWFLGTAAA